ncbi:MAG: pyridoxamine 5'-phosphate oxidase family protein [Phyllobacteriaceae bacterium]|nr:pyridoxamine 5'-phosphate oxidase family protein [Phyllobacteriaceae bacterium]
MAKPSSDIAFSPSVKAEQERRGSRAAYAALERAGGFETGLDRFPAAFLARIDTAFLGTVNADSQPYVQHRGGAPGFIRIADRETLVFAERRGNRQYVTAGNLADNPKAFLFLIDYERRRRIKLWGRARLVEIGAAHVALLGLDPDDDTIDRVIEFEVAAWDVNCPEYIPQKVAVATVAGLRARIAELEADVARLGGGVTTRE